jgi:thiol-disulfide isomerase/thioredoxin
VTGLWVLVAVLVAGVAAGVLLKARNGRVREADPSRPKPARELPGPVAAVLDPASAVTLVQISTTFCAPCRHTRALLTSLAEETEGLRHVDLDVTDRPGVAKALGVLRTPTTIAFDQRGHELLRVGGVPRGPKLLAALAAHLPSPASPVNR